MSIFTVEEELDLHRTRSLRQDLITQMTKEKLPDSNRDIRLLMELCDSADNHVLTTAKLRIDDKSNTTSNGIAAMVSSLLEKISRQQATGNVSQSMTKVNRELPVNNDFTFTDGEMDDSKADVKYEDLNF